MRGVRMIAKLALAVATGILAAKGIEAGGRKVVGKGKKVLDERIRTVAKEEVED